MYLHHTPPDQYVRYVLIITQYPAWSLPPVCFGESKSVRPDETNELFAGTTECHEIAAEFLGSFGVPYEVVGGNHGT